MHYYGKCILCSPDVDECERGLSACSVNAECVNTYGGYNCTCTLGYEGDGIVCKSRLLSGMKEGA